jgi:dUTP pyrophosphatase
MKLKIIRLDKDIPTPRYMREDDVAFDLYSRESHTLKPMEWKLFGIGLKMEIPKGYIGNIRDRSGLAVKYAIHTLAGVIDPGFRGEVGVVLINLSNKDFNVEKGMRIAQMIIQQVEYVDIVEVDELSDAERNQNSFGSTGLY